MHAPGPPPYLYVNSEPIFVGQTNDGSLNGSFLFDELRIYQRALTPTEIALLYAKPCDPGL